MPTGYVGPNGQWVSAVDQAAGGGIGLARPLNTLWANRVSYQIVGALVRFTDVGPSESGNGGGNILYWTGTRWKPVGSNLLLDSIDSANAGNNGTTEQQLNGNHVAVNAGLTANGDRFRFMGTVSKNGTTDTCTVRLHYGPLGTASDPVIATIATLAGASQTLGVMLEFKRVSSTSLQKEGNADTSTSYNGASSSWASHPAPKCKQRESSKTCDADVVCRKVSMGQYIWIECQQRQREESGCWSE